MLPRMSDVRYDDAMIGPCLLTFDGRILELFTARDGSKHRMIVGMLFVRVDEPNRHGRREISFRAAPGSRGGGGFTVFLAAEQWPVVQPFVDEVKEATGQ
jgi:hypothetical protein